MSLRLRKVPTASGATAVQIVTKRHGKPTVIEHLGSAHTPAQLAALEEAGREKSTSPPDNCLWASTPEIRSLLVRVDV